MEKKILSILMLAIFLASTISIASNNTALAHTESDPYTTDLLAGQTIDVGDVHVWNDGDYLYVKYLITDPEWCLLETHLQVATSLVGIPQKNGNPIPGKFTYKATHDCATEYTYMIELIWDPATELYIAAHAKVQELITAAPYAASTVISSTQGTRKDGTPVLPARSNPSNALVKDYSGGAVTFYSLGFGGEIIVSFDCPIRNGEGNDISVWEVTNGAYPPERAEVSASQDGTTWVNLGTATNGRTAPQSSGNSLTESVFDLNSLTWASYIKIVDVSDRTLFGADADAFDLDGIYSLQDCVNTETAWGDGTGFSGKNWATYFTYTVQSTGPTVTPGGPTWTKGAGVRYRGWNTGKEIFLGPMFPPSALPRVEAEYNEFGSVGSKTYQITFTFNKDDNAITTSITSPDQSITFDFDVSGSPGCTDWDAMEIVVRDSRTDSGVALENVMLESFDLGDFRTVDKAGTPGWQSWTVTGFDFSESFTVTADLVVDGYNGSESIKVEFNVGCLTP